MSRIRTFIIMELLNQQMIILVYVDKYRDFTKRVLKSSYQTERKSRPVRRNRTTLCS